MLSYKGCDNPFSALYISTYWIALMENNTVLWSRLVNIIIVLFSK